MFQSQNRKTNFIMTFIHISCYFLFRLHHKKIDTSTTGELTSEPQNYECINYYDDNNDDCTSINANITFNNVKLLNNFIHLLIMISLENVSCQSIKTEVQSTLSKKEFSNALSSKSQRKIVHCLYASWSHFSCRLQVTENMLLVFKGSSNLTSTTNYWRQTTNVTHYK